VKGSDPNFWAPVSIATITGGRWLKKPPDLATPTTGLGIDGRTLRLGEVFVAIAGEQFDGHEFLPQAQAAGAAMALVERSIAQGPESPPLPLLRVPSTDRGAAGLGRTLPRGSERRRLPDS
jgi:UDP-N-acetylmuramoyl-tripeptide--D-alanyl-D-alanine ligase